MENNTKLPFETSVIRINKQVSYAPANTELLMVLEGTLSISGTDMELSTNLVESDLALLPPLDHYQLDPSQDNLILSIKLDNRFLLTAFQNNLPVILCRNEDSHNSDFSQLRKVLSQIACISYTTEALNPLLLYSLIYQTLDLLSKHYEHQEIKPDNDQKGSRHLQHLQKIKLYILQNFNTPITLNDLAAHLYMTPQYLSKFIKKHLGIGFYEYLNSIRLTHAVEELLTTDETITTIVFSNGFPNLASFNKLFKEKYNSSPQKYRKEQLTVSAPEKQTSGFTEIAFDSIKNHFSTYLQAPEQEIIDTLQTHQSVHGSIQNTVHFPHIWEQAVNLGFSMDLSNSDFRSQINLFQKDVSFRYARFQGIFSESLSLDLNDPSSYNYYNIDKNIDYLYSVNLLPFIEIADKPQKVVKNNDTLQYFIKNAATAFQMTNLKTTFINFIRHSINRYGALDVVKWRFEYWLAHSADMTYDDERIETYIETYAELHTALKALLPNAQLGGPGFNTGSDSDTLKKIIIGLANRGITPDFVSFYIFPYSLVNGPQRSKERPAQKHPSEVNPELPSLMIWSKREFREKLLRLKRNIRQWNPNIIDLYATEWNLDFVSRNYMNDSCFKAAFIIDNILNTFEGVHSVYWLLSDISSEYTDSDGILFGGTGLISRNGIRKPAYFAYNFLSKLGNNLIRKGDGYIITSHSEHEFEVLVYNYKYLSDYYRMNFDHDFDPNHMDNLFEDLKELSLDIRLSDVTSGRYRIRQYTLNNDSGSVLDEWLRLNQIKNIRQSELSYLYNICVPRRHIFYQDSDENGEFQLHCQLKPNEVKLFVINMEL